MLRIVLRSGHGPRRRGWHIDAKHLLVQDLDDSSWSLPALTANSMTTWRLTLCAYSLTRMMMEVMLLLSPLIEYLLCGGNLQTSSHFIKNILISER